jgi:hypothetical protein
MNIIGMCKNATQSYRHNIEWIKLEAKYCTKLLDMIIEIEKSC